ncbi:MAG: hypothetical protein V4590_05745 [Bacteroidota bacterium]
MKQLNKFVVVGLIVITTIIGIKLTTKKSNKLRNIHQTKMEQPTTFKSILR